MRDRLSNYSSSYFTYANYWRPSVSLGTTKPHSGASKIKDKLEVRHKWQIITFATCVMIAITMVIGIYNAVLYQNSSTTLSLTTTSDTTTITTTITSSPATAAGTTDSVNYISNTTTTAITTLAVDTTSAAVSTDVVTTKTPPICPSMLPFGDDAGDRTLTEVDITPFNYNLWDTETKNGTLVLYPNMGAIRMASDKPQKLEVRILFGVSIGTQWSVYYRNVSSKADQDAIACLVNNFQTSNATVVTWVNNAMPELQAAQLIVASFEQSATYIIRIYSENVPQSNSIWPVSIRFGTEETTYVYFKKETIKDFAGQRQILDVSKARSKGQSLTVVEEGKNCEVFTC